MAKEIHTYYRNQPFTLAHQLCSSYKSIYPKQQISPRRNNNTAFISRTHLLKKVSEKSRFTRNPSKTNDDVVGALAILAWCTKFQKRLCIK